MRSLNPTRLVGCLVEKMCWNLFLVLFQKGEGLSPRLLGHPEQ